MNFSQQGELPCPVFAIAGDRDDFVDEQLFRRWPGINARVIEGADHFFQALQWHLPRPCVTFILTESHLYLSLKL